MSVPINYQCIDRLRNRQNGARTTLSWAAKAGADCKLTTQTMTKPRLRRELLSASSTKKWENEPTMIRSGGVDGQLLWSLRVLGSVCK